MQQDLLPFLICILSPESRCFSPAFGVSAGTACGITCGSGSELLHPCSISLLLPFLAFLGLPTCPYRAMAVRPAEDAEAGLLFWQNNNACLGQP